MVLEIGLGNSRSEPQLTAQRKIWRVFLSALYMLPSILAFIFYGLLASDRYVSEAQFVVRTASKPISTGSFGAILQMTGLSKANDDVFAVQSFMQSRDAVRQLEEKLPLRQIFARAEADPLSRFPSPLRGDSFEQFHRYLASMITTTYVPTTGISTLRVESFEPEDSRAVADALLDITEQAVNQMNTRIQGDAVKVSRDEVLRSEERMIAAQIELTRFRNAELMIDPVGSAVIVTELIGALSAELAKVQAETRELEAAAAENPTLPALRRRAAAIEAQIKQERLKISDASGGLAAKLSKYERLVLEQEFAKASLASAVKSLETARTEVRRQQLYLERIVAPRAADYPIEPKRIRSFLTVTCINLVALLVGWLFFAGIREHGAT